MQTCTPTTDATTLPINGLAWSWRNVGATEIDVLTPLVMAADPSGTEALYWRRDSLSWLMRDRARSITSVQCAAGLTLGLFFCSLAELEDGARRLVVERLRWLELARPHRSLDAILVILVEHGRRLACRDVILLKGSATERSAQEALDHRARTAGFVALAEGWAILL